MALSCLGAVGTLGMLTLAGCPADLENPGRFDLAAGASSSTGGGSVASGGGTAVDTSCLSDAFTSCTMCHFDGSPPTLGAGLDLQTAGVAARLVNVAATHTGASGTCPAAKLIDTTAPDASWLLVKVNGKQGTCGSLMPLIGDPLSAAQIACLHKFATDEAAAQGSSPATGSAAGSSGAAAAAGGPASSTAGTGGT